MQAAQSSSAERRGPAADRRRGVGRPRLAEDVEQVSIRYPRFMLEAVAEIVDERGGTSIVDRATVIREATLKGLQAMGKLKG